MGQRQQAVVNGTRDPETVTLSEGQKLAIGWLFGAGEPRDRFCTGTVISPTLVITASHCTEELTAAQIGFGVGETPETAVATVQVAQVFEHPGVDAALLVLAQPITDLAPVQPIRFNRATLGGALDILHQEIDGAGFGDTRDVNRFGRYFANVLVVEIREDYIMIDGRGVEGLCFGDSGGPALTVGTDGDVVVIAVLHAGAPTCTGQDLMTRLDAIADWIETTAGAGPGGPQGACGGLDYFGRCEGEVAIWCDEGQVARRNCREMGEVCGFVGEQLGFYCRAPSACDVIPNGGMCDGSFLVRCDQEQRVELDCATLGMVCAQARPVSACLPEALVPPGAEINPEAGTFGRATRVNYRGGCAVGRGAGADAVIGLLGILGLLALRRRRSA